MTQISAQMVKDLREKTGAGMMDCKKALTETGDFEAAVTYLREKGLAAAAKKAGRIASEGAVAALIEDNCAAIIEVNCETDFVGRNPDFLKLTENLAGQIIRSSRRVQQAGSAEISLSAFEQEPFLDGAQTVSAMVADKVGTIGEKIAIRRGALLCNGNAYGSYIHMGGSIGVVVELQVEDASKAKSARIQDLARDLAMHVAAANPAFFARSDVDQKTIENERHIYRQQMVDSNKPEAIMAKIIDGKLEKFFGESCFLEQKFIKDPDHTITKVIAEAGKAEGTQIKATRFVRYKVGEGMEQRADDFAEEVAKMVGKN